MNKFKIIKISFSVATILFSILSFLLLDFSSMLQKITLFAKEEEILAVMDLVIKIMICALWIVINLYVFVIIKHMEQNRKLYSDEEIVKYISKYKNLQCITLFGFSLSFAESLRSYLNENKIIGLRVTIYLPSDSFIQKRIIEGIPLESRFAQLNGRLHEWHVLRTSNMLEELNVKRFNAVPVANGTIINNKEIFLFTYNWKMEGDKVRFTKIPREKRLKILIKKEKEEAIWKYIEGTICSYEEMALTHDESNN